MDISLRQTRAFEAVADEGSITRAAERLHLTQPAVSMQIKKLEEQAGLALIQVVGKRVFLTEAGKEMLRYCRRINRDVQEARAVMQALNELRHGRISIGVASTVNYFATHFIASFHALHPEIQIRMEVTNRETLLQELQELDKDLFLMGQPPADSALEATPFMENPLVVIASPRHPLTECREIALEALAEEPFVVREPGSGTRMALEGFLTRHGMELASHMEMNSNEAIKQAVMAGLGLGVVSRHTVRLELAAGALVELPVAGFPLLRQWYLVHRRDRPLSHAAREFKRYLLEAAEEGRLSELPEQAEPTG
ncbi:MAG: LysR family transcriptional regulator [Gammaproteobacteria bacterium]|nr:MAG: LysR family transcriptional regulator [Gammaproteobacteria bacterium]